MNLAQTTMRSEIGKLTLDKTFEERDTLNQNIIKSIDKETKDASNNSMKALNVMGANLNYDISAFFGRNSKYSYLIGFKDQRIFNAAYTKDFYQLVFYGNKPYLGDTKNLAGSNINSLRFQELNLTIYKSKTFLFFQKEKCNETIFGSGNKNILPVLVIRIPT